MNKYFVRHCRVNKKCSSNYNLLRYNQEILVEICCGFCLLFFIKLFKASTLSALRQSLQCGSFKSNQQQPPNLTTSAYRVFLTVTFYLPVKTTVTCSRASTLHYVTSTLYLYSPNKTRSSKFYWFSKMKLLMA